MIYYFSPVICIFLYLICRNFCNKHSFLLSYTGDLHQQATNKKNVPLIGGSILCIMVCINLFFIKEYYLLIFLFLIFSLGALSDLKLIISPLKRLFWQFIILIFFSYFLNLYIVTTKIFFLDYLISLKLLNLFFVTFCILIVLNGSNFIDGLNGLVIGYLILFFFILLRIENTYDVKIIDLNFYLIFTTLFILFFLNLQNKIFLGDSGAYFSGLIISYYAITLQYKVNYISPYFIILLLWYPCFENLFSIIRKSKKKKSKPISPDTMHLHHMIFYFFHKKYFRSKLLCNNFSSIIILFFNYVIFEIGLINIYSTKILILLIFTCLIIYSSIYFYIQKKLK